MSENPDLYFGTLLWAVMTQNKDDYIGALETLVDVFATNGKLPQEINKADPRDKLSIYAAALSMIASIVVDEAIDNDRALQAIAACLCQIGHLEFSDRLAAKPPKNPA